MFDIVPDDHQRLKKGKLLRCDTFAGTGNDHSNPSAVPFHSRPHARSNRSSIQPAITASMNRLKPLALSIHIFGSVFEQMLPLVSTTSMACSCELQDIGTRALVSNPLPLPTSEQPSYNVLFTCYTAIDMLNNDILLIIFNLYRLDNVMKWNARLWWRKLTHVCQRWRYLVHES